MTAPRLPDTPANRILLVDDEEIVLVALRETLTRVGYRVAVAPNPMPAIEMMKNEAFSVIISDHQMPGMTGLEFLSRAKEIQPDAARILITAVLCLDTVIDAINKGEIYRFIVKPWLREELLATVKNAVQRYELLCRNSILQATTLAMNDQLAQLNRSLEEQVTRVAEQNRELASLNQFLEQNLQRSVELCFQIMQTFYPMLGIQARRVFEIIRALSESLDLPADQRKILEISALLHDVGLVGVSRRLIRRWQQSPAALDEAERALIEQHPVLGQELAAFVHNLEAVGAVIRSHHERFDGTGYPDHLAGDSIPWLRLLAVAVGYADGELSHAASIDQIRLGSGSAYDPEAVRAFLRALPKAVIQRKEREVLLSELLPGMVLAKGVYTPNGLLLIPEGQQLSSTSIDKLLNHNRINPITQSLIVYC